MFACSSLFFFSSFFVDVDFFVFFPFHSFSFAFLLFFFVLFLFFLLSFFFSVILFLFFFFFFFLSFFLFPKSGGPLSLYLFFRIICPLTSKGKGQNVNIFPLRTVVVFVVCDCLCSFLCQRVVCACLSF